MGKTYKDRDKIGRPRVPEWARPKPTKVHTGSKKDHQDKDLSREEYLEALWSGEDE